MCKCGVREFLCRSERSFRGLTNEGWYQCGVRDRRDAILEVPKNGGGGGAVPTFELNDSKVNKEVD